MPIENLEPSNQNNEYLPSTSQPSSQTYFASKNTVLAGSLKVKHPLMDELYLVYGFISSVDNNRDFEGFEVRGMTIKLKEVGIFHFYDIYTKVVIDMKQTLFYQLFPQLDKIKNINRWIGGGYKSRGDEDPDNKKNYFFFKNQMDLLPTATSDEIYLVCKCREEGRFKYELFLPHEITIVNT